MGTPIFFCDVCGDSVAVQDLGRHVRVVGLPGQVRHLCERHRVGAGRERGYDLNLKQVAERVRADRDRAGRTKRGDVSRAARKFGVDAVTLRALVEDPR